MLLDPVVLLYLHTLSILSVSASVSIKANDNTNMQ